MKNQQSIWKTWRLRIALITALSSLPAFAQTLVVSDIDDTIKISHVLDIDSAINNFPRTKNHFTGMADSYQALRQSKTNIQFAYVTNAIHSVSGKFHQSFLSQNNFPEGGLFLRTSPLEKNFKVTTIRNLIQDNNLQELIMVGDNGEKDIEVYDQIRREFPHLRTRIYIHVVYSKIAEEQKGQASLPGQKTFVTSLDLMAHWVREGLVPLPQFQKFLRKIGPKILKENLKNDDGEMAFPSWMDCRDHVGITTSRNISIDERIRTILRAAWNTYSTPEDLWGAYQKLLIHRCSIEAIED